MIRIPFLLICVVFMGLLAGCGSYLALSVNHRETGRAFLIKDQPQPTGYGLYSYLLFGAPPTPQSRERYLSALQAFMEIDPIAEAAESHDPEKLNITFVLLKQSPVETPAPEWLLENYDYIRARTLLRCLPDQAERLSGPYIISVAQPPDPQKPLSVHYLYQDLTRVPADVMSLWIRDFRRQVSQPRFWEKNELYELAKTLRTSVAILAEGMPDILAGMNTMIQLVEKPRNP